MSRSKKKVMSFTFEEIDLDKLTTDSIYQRTVDERRKERICNHFWELAMRPPVVSVRASGEMVIIDGMQRCSYLTKKGYTSVVCQVVRGLSLLEEQHLFEVQNDVKLVSRNLKIKGGYFAGDVNKIAFVRDLAKFGITLPFTKVDFPECQVLRNAGQLEDMWKVSDVCFYRTCKILKEIYSVDGALPSDAKGGAFIWGLFQFIHEGIDGKGSLDYEKFYKNLLSAKNRGWGPDRMRLFHGHGSQGYVARAEFKNLFARMYQDDPDVKEAILQLNISISS